MMRIFAGLLLCIFASSAQAQQSLDRFAADLLCEADPDCEVTPPLPEDSSPTIKIGTDLPLPDDADLSKMEIQRTLVTQGTYLTTEGKVRPLAARQSPDAFSYQKETLGISDQVMPGPVVPTPYVIDPLGVEQN